MSPHLTFSFTSFAESLSLVLRSSPHSFIRTSTSVGTSLALSGLTQKYRSGCHEMVSGKLYTLANCQCW